MKTIEGLNSLPQNVYSQLPERAFDLVSKTEPFGEYEKALHPLACMHTFTNKILEDAVLERIQEQELLGQEHEGRLRVQMEDLQGRANRMVRGKIKYTKMVQSTRKQRLTVFFYRKNIGS